MASEVTQDQDSMLRYWTGMMPDMIPEELVANLVRKFKLTENAAWTVLVRFRNAEHTKVMNG